MLTRNRGLPRSPFAILMKTGKPAQRLMLSVFVVTVEVQVGDIVQSIRLMIMIAVHFPWCHGLVGLVRSVLSQSESPSSKLNLMTSIYYVTYNCGTLLGIYLFLCRLHRIEKKLDLILAHLKIPFP